MATDATADRPGQRVKILGPVAQPTALKISGYRVRDRAAGLAGELSLQRIKILSAGHHAAIAALDGEGHPEMRR